MLNIKIWLINKYNNANSCIGVVSVLKFVSVTVYGKQIGPDNATDINGAEKITMTQQIQMTHKNICHKNTYSAKNYKWRGKYILRNRYRRRKK